MTDPAHPPKVAVRPVRMKPHAHAATKEPLHPHKRSRPMLGSAAEDVPAVEIAVEKE